MREQTHLTILETRASLSSLNSLRLDVPPAKSVKGIHETMSSGNQYDVAYRRAIFVKLSMRLPSPSSTFSPLTALLGPSFAMMKRLPSPFGAGSTRMSRACLSLPLSIHASFGPVVKPKPPSAPVLKPSRRNFKRPLDRQSNESDGLCTTCMDQQT